MADVAQPIGILKQIGLVAGLRWPPIRLDWERVHADWRDHAIRNELYRRDAHGHDVPVRDDHAHPAVINQDNHDKDKDHDYGH